MLERLDWSNCENQFKLARDVLLENYDDACLMMEQLDKDEMLYAYIEWPLFKRFIKTQQFKEKFKSI